MGGAVTVNTSADHPTTKIKVDKYVLTIGFEVNFDGAFVMKNNSSFSKKEELTQIADVDYGHAFFYLTQNNKIISSLSFGPNGAGKVLAINPIKNGFADARPGTPDYKIWEVVHLFRIPVTEEIAIKIENANDIMRDKITSGKLKYTAWKNDTCAATAYSVLKDLVVLPDGRKLPNGQGAVIAQGHLLPFNLFNPYMWHHNLSEAGLTEIIYPTREKNIEMFSTEPSDEHEIVHLWDLDSMVDIRKKQDDPLFKNHYL